MTTQPQLDSFAEEPHDAGKMRALALDAVARSRLYGATVDEAYATAYPGRFHSHAPVDSFRVCMRHLREDGLIRDSGNRRRNRNGDRDQAVWVLGDDRDVVEAHRRKKLEKFPTEWLVDELRARGAMQ